MDINVTQSIIQSLNDGTRRIANPTVNGWEVDQEAKNAILNYFASQKMTRMSDGLNNWYDKIPLKFKNFSEDDFSKLNIRAVPQSIVRFGAYVAPKSILMPCYINIGAYVDEGSTIDTFSTIGSCAQIGKNVHIGGGSGIGGVLEPLQATPTIIEDGCFIGARCEIAEGVVVGKNSVIAMGTMIGQSTKIYDRNKDTWYKGKIPPYSVVVPGTVASSTGQCQLNAAIIVKTVNQQTLDKTSINDILHEFA